MKRIIIFLIALLATTAVSSAQTIKFERLNHNFGDIVHRGDAQSIKVSFTNSGDKPLVVIRSKTDCSCVSVKIPNKPIPAGGKGEIIITYNPTKDLGEFNKGIEIYTNSTSGGRTILFIEGDVVKKRR